MLSAKTYPWTVVVIRTFVVITGILSLVGLFFILQTSFLFFAVRLPKLEDPAYLQELFYVRTIINFVCVVLLLLACPYLWRLQARGLRLFNAVFVFELFYFLGDPALTLILFFSRHEIASEVADSLAATAGIGNMGLALQLVTAYPIIGLVLLNISFRKLDKTKGRRDEAPASQPV